MIRGLTGALLLLACSSNQDVPIRAEEIKSVSASAASGSGGQGGVGPTSVGSTTTAGTGGSTQGNPYQSGSRLRAKFIAGSDGTKSFVGWHDSMREEDCSFSLASDGKSRCLPTSMPGGNEFFSDATCTSMLAYRVQSTCQVLPKYGSVTTPAPDGCTSNSRIFLLGTKYNGTIYYVNSGGCTAASGPVVASYEMYSLSTEVSAGSFVEGTEMIE